MALAHPAKTFSPGSGVSAAATVERREGSNLAVLTLDDLGVIRDCSQACLDLFGYRPDELVGLHVSALLPELPESGLVLDGRINPRLAYLCHCGVAFQARHRDGRRLPSELFINRLDAHNIVVLLRRLDGPARLPDLQATH